MPAPRVPVYNEGHLRQFLGALMDHTIGVVELRIFHAQFAGRNNLLESSNYNQTFSGWYDDLNALVVDAKKLIDVSGYVTVNPVDRDLLARSCNKLSKARREASTSDADVVCLRWMYLDIDPKRKTETSSTDQELAAAVARRDAVLTDLPELAECSMWGRSGNGCWILVRLPDYPNDAEHRELVGRALAIFAGRYGDDRVIVDPKTKNPSRVMCLAGTRKCKGSSMPDRPWRLVTLDGGGAGQVDSAFDLKSFIAHHTPTPALVSLPPSDPPPAVAPQVSRATPGFRTVDIAYALSALDKEATAVALAPEGNRNNQLNISAVKIGEFVGTGILDREEVVRRLEAAAVQSGLSNGDIHATIESGLRKGIGQPRSLGDVGKLPAGVIDLSKIPLPVATLQPVDIEALKLKAEEMIVAGKFEEVCVATDFHAELARLEILNAPQAEAVKASLRRIDGYRERSFDKVMAGYREALRVKQNAPEPEREGHDFTDLGNGLRLVDLYGYCVRFCKPYGDWLIYDGKRWAGDSLYSIEAMAQKIPAHILTEVPASLNKEAAQPYSEWALASQSKDRILAMIHAARSMVAVTPFDLDRNPWLLNVQNGTLNLKTGEFYSHRASDLVTKIANVSYDKDAAAPTWDRFILEVMNNDEELAAYLRRAVGYSITGVIREHAFFFLHGTGRNGKTTLLNTLFTILGDYANEIDSDLLIAQNNKQHPTALTELEGRRLVSADETDEGRRLAEAQVKKLTGGNPIQARRMYEDFYTFRPTHHLFFAANHKPEIRGMDPGIWRRIKLIPFEVSFDPGTPKGRQPDLELEGKLTAESSGILNWMLQGCREWQDQGLAEPRVVREVVSDYRQEMDTLGWFIEERCKEDSHPGSGRCALSILYGEYVAWCGASNIQPPIGIRKFSGQIGDKGFKSFKSHSVVYKLGIRPKTEAERQAEQRDSSYAASQDGSNGGMEGSDEYEGRAEYDFSGMGESAWSGHSGTERVPEGTGADLI